MLGMERGAVKRILFVRQPTSEVKIEISAPEEKHDDSSHLRVTKKRLSQSFLWLS